MNGCPSKPLQAERRAASKPARAPSAGRPAYPLGEGQS